MGGKYSPDKWPSAEGGSVNILLTGKVKKKSQQKERKEKI